MPPASTIGSNVTTSPSSRAAFQCLMPPMSLFSLDGGSTIPLRWLRESDHSVTSQPPLAWTNTKKSSCCLFASAHSRARQEQRRSGAAGEDLERGTSSHQYSSVSGCCTHRGADRGPRGLVGAQLRGSVAMRGRDLLVQRVEPIKPVRRTERGWIAEESFDAGHRSRARSRRGWGWAAGRTRTRRAARSADARADRARRRAHTTLR